MATSSKIQLPPPAQLDAQVFLPGITQESADKTSELLQENHEKHHIFFNQSGFHNHIVHHLLTLHALRASPHSLQTAYTNNASYQRPVLPTSTSTLPSLHDPATFSSHLGSERHYATFLAFFQREIAARGWQSVLNSYVFQDDDPRADDMLVRMFAGFLHPIIHLGFGVEFAQPAVIAEALAQAAVHEVWLKPFFLEAEARAAVKQAEGEGERVPIVRLLGEIRADEKLRGAARFDDANKVRDGILARAPEAMLSLASRYHIPPTTTQEELEERNAEMVNAAAYFTTAALRRDKVAKFDFFFMHCVNLSTFFAVFLRQEWLSMRAKRRLLEWKVRLDLALYASRGAPELLAVEEVRRLAGEGGGSSWEDVCARIVEFADDGHASKFVRALMGGEGVCRKFATEGAEGEKGNEEMFPIRGDMWRVLGNMVVDSVEASGPTWVRSCGFEEAWRDVPDREEGGSKL
ncbi:hypothetical protein BU24DRAFT_457136 [Aaosphaeria arxii CBS 175.79]|uniref:HypA-like protein n=1 Tax=Aaosphaeria arxii CBS 175.79 TaxID=1450172 RepID=A0A6A5Y6G8_9PLEO|nr:uncharacterized protein BU24DRAFT_457136 [Aaosphaeria arxii CBS 175.79]KAF2021128.1 hypothetical protein BU24DRAFT_457136 [Aaosphaeria arxii CBS 175.79]